MYKSVNKIANQVNFLALAIQALLVFKFGVKCQQKPNVLECVSASYNECQRFAAWRSGGFLAQMFNRRNALEPTTKLSYEALHPPLRQTAVTSCPSFLSCLFVVMLCRSLCVGSHFLFFVFCL